MWGPMVHTNAQTVKDSEEKGGNSGPLITNNTHIFSWRMFHTNVDRVERELRV